MIEKLNNSELRGPFYLSMSLKAKIIINWYGEPVAVFNNSFPVETMEKILETLNKTGV